MNIHNGPNIAWDNMRYQPPHQSSLVLALSVIICLRSLKTEDCSMDALQRDVLRRVARPYQQQSLPRELVFVSEVVSVQDPAENLSIPGNSGICGTKKWPEIHYIL